MDSKSDGWFILVFINILRAHGFQHLLSIVHHIITHRIFIFLERGIRNDDWETPFIGFIGAERDAVIFVGKAFAKALHPDRPEAKGGEFLFEIRAKATNPTAPALASAAALIAKSTQVISAFGRLAEVSVARNVEATGATTIL